MKRVIFLRILTAVSAAFFCLSFFSCSKKADDESLVPSVVLFKKAELCLLGRDGAMHPFVSLDRGDTVQAVKNDGKYYIKKIKSPAAESSLSGEQSETAPIENTWLRVVYDSVDFWVKKDCLALNARNAVIIEETENFKFGTLTALSIDSEEEKPAVEIFYFDQDSASIKTAFVNSDCVSTLEDDIAVTQIVEELKTTVRAVPRNELFKRAQQYNPCPKVLAALNAQKIEKQTYSYQKVLNSMKNRGYQVHIDELMTVDQSKDPFAR